jgi:HK97 gp10 family phage protein
MIVSSVKLDTSKLDHLAAELKPRAERILTQSATAIQAMAIVNTVRVDTGAMKNGWRVAQETELQRTIYNTQNYAVFQELGTSKMSASPMLVPAVENYRQKLEAAWGALFVE